MKKFIIFIILINLIFINQSCENDNYIINSAPPTNFESSKMLIIDLKGAIRLPNVYSVKEGTILYELINLAGGFEEDADVNNVNLALELKENQMILIPYKKSIENNNTFSLININTANLETLCTLPGIGTAKGNNIINYRNSNGYFITIDDIKKVNGISEGLFNKIKDYICV